MSRSDVAIFSLGVGRAYEVPPLPLGGAERQMGLLARSLAERGKRVALVVHARGRLTAPPEPGLRLVAVPSPFAGRSARTSPPLRLVDVCRALLRADADVYVVRGGGPAAGLVAAICRARGRRFVFSSAIDGDWTLETLRSPLKRRLHAWGVRSCDAAVVQSQQQYRLAKASFPGLRRVVEIPSFGEHLDFSDPDGGSESPPRKFVWVSRVMGYKQPLRYLDLAEAMPDAEFLMVARMSALSLDQELVAQVRARASELPNVELHDEMDREALMRCIASAPALVSTSRLEGMPNVFLEAWARGVPVISLDFDPDDVIARHDLGAAARGSWESFLTAARHAWNRSDVDAATRARLRDHVRQRHGVTSVADRWLELLEQLRPPAG